MMAQTLQERLLLASLRLVHDGTHEILTDDEVAIDGARGLLKPACGIHRVADHGELDVLLSADVAENGRTIVEPEPDPDRGQISQHSFPVPAPRGDLQLIRAGKRPDGVLIARFRNTEDRQNCVADVARD